MIHHDIKENYILYIDNEINPRPLSIDVSIDMFKIKKL